jgi:hypothetical protein
LAGLLLPLVIAFVVSMGAGMVAGRRAVVLPAALGLGAGVLIAVNGSGDTDSLFLTVWLIAGVAIGVWGALVGARKRD